MKRSTLRDAVSKPSKIEFPVGQQKAATTGHQLRSKDILRSLDNEIRVLNQERQRRHGRLDPLPDKVKDVEDSQIQELLHQHAERRSEANAYSALPMATPNLERPKKCLMGLLLCALSRHVP